MHSILHIGLGSFHRAHQAVYLHRLREQGDELWSIVGGNIRDDMAETMGALIQQQGEYTLETISPAGEHHYERIRSIREVIAFDPSLRRVIEVGADPSTRIISFTVTESGYYLDAENVLDVRSVDLRVDLEKGSSRTIYGAVCAILRERMERGGGPVTLLSCDNLRSNGVRFRAALLDFLSRRGETALRRWTEAHTSCPCNMVDRITPRPPPDVAVRVEAATGWDDRAPVTSESFIQWAIEDDFVAGRPRWERVGAVLVGTVHAHEEAKIRILNATHGCVAWAGALKGLTFIHEAMATPAIKQMAFDYVTDDVIPCLDAHGQASPIDLATYRDVVLERFGNPFVHDTNERVAADGFAKIQGFIAPTLRERLNRGESIAGVARLPVLLLAVLQRWNAGTLGLEYRDQLMKPSLVHAICAATDPLAAFVGDRSLWGDLSGNEAMLEAFKAARGPVSDMLGLDTGF